MLRNLLVQFLRDARAQRLRLALTIGGLAWGTAAVVLLLAFGEGFGRQQMVRQQGLGESIVINWPMRTTLPWQGLPRGRTIAMTPEDLTWLRREVPEIARLSEEFQRGRARIAWQDRSLAVNLTATNVEYGAMRNLVPSAGGRFLNEVDLAERRRVVFLGDAIAAELFGNESEVVGRTVRIDGVPFLVIGVMAKKLQDSSYNGRDENRATIPSTTFRAL
ncbi:MAG TPA: ABC transporter permease, partial [Thermoanaerobaculia bacterium]|nr:ABC transporter permease [Thermoanaerobaculia bacterium]